MKIIVHPIIFPVGNIYFPTGILQWFMEDDIMLNLTPNFSFINMRRHREDGPAVEWADGDIEWWINGKLHREDGPAIECVDGTKIWYINGKNHRIDGPAIEYPNGNQTWYYHNKIHREDGPADISANGTKHWYYHGKLINCKSQEEFEKLIKLKAFW